MQPLASFHNNIIITIADSFYPRLLIYSSFNMQHAHDKPLYTFITFYLLVTHTAEPHCEGHLPRRDGLHGTAFGLLAR